MALIQLGLLRSALCRSLLPTARSSVAECVRLPSAVPRGCGRDAVPAAPLIRHYANKKSKAKGKGQPGKVKINTELVHDILNLEEVKEDMAAILLNLKEEYSRNLSLRTSPDVGRRAIIQHAEVDLLECNGKDGKYWNTESGALDHIAVTTMNGKVPLKQLGQISVKSPQLIVVNMTGSPEVTAAAARALRESSLRLNPEVDGTIIRVPIPMVTREHRENLCKLAKEFSHKAKELLRKVRSGAISTLKKSKDGVSEDTLRLIEQHVQQMTDSFTADIDKQLAAKTKELLG